jgi:hypothetical protein
MKLEPAIKEELQQGINELIRVEFPWCKEQIIRTRELVDIEDAEIWMRYRNGMDRLLCLQRGINLSEFPSPDFAVELIDIEKIGENTIDSLNPHDILQYSAYLFRNCGVEAWVQATETLIGLLSMRINSFSYDGEKTKANIKLKRALKHQADGRMARSSSHLQSVSSYKKASEKAVEGLVLLNKVNPYTRFNFWIGIILIIIALLTLILN